MRLILTTIILTLLAQPVWAQKVYYCETTAFAQVTEENEVLKARSYRFKMAVSANEVKISGAEFFSFPFDEVLFDEVLFADDGAAFAAVYHFKYLDQLKTFPVTIAAFSPPQLKVMDFNDTLSAFHAHCEDS